MMMARVKQVSTQLGKLGEIIGSRTDMSSPRHQAAQSLMRKIRDHDHILTSNNYFFRENLSSDFAYREFETKRRHVTSFLSEVQSGLLSAKAITSAHCYISSTRSEAYNGVNSLHIDLTPDVLIYPPSTVRFKRLGECIYEKMRTKATDILGTHGSICDSLIEIHVHCDIRALMPAPTLIARKREQTRAGRSGLLAQTGHIRDAQAVVEDAGLPVSDDVEMGPDDELGDLSKAKKLDASTVFKGSWFIILSQDGDFEYIKSLHVLLFAKALAEKFNEREQKPDIYLHGASLAKLGVGGVISFPNVAIGRQCDSVLLSSSEVPTLSPSLEIEECTGIATGRKAMFGGSKLQFIDNSLDSNSMYQLENSMDVFDSTCCWKIDASGIWRYPIGDTNHAQSQTRFIRALLTISSKSFPEKLRGRPWKVLLISRKEEGPMIAASFKELQKFEVFQQVEERYIHINKLAAAIERFNASLLELSLLFAPSGCAECPSSRRVNQSSFVKAFFSYKSIFPNVSLSIAETEAGNAQMEVLTCMAFVFQRIRSNTIPPYLRHDLEKNCSMWCERIRKHSFFDKSYESCPSYNLPELCDLKLQFSRARATVKYWNQTIEDRCSIDDLICDRSSGFLASGLRLHETEEDLIRRQKLLQDMVRTCSCSSGCKAGQGGKKPRCGCRRQVPPTFCFFCKCHPSCENRGVTAPIDSTPICAPEITPATTEEQEINFDELPVDVIQENDDTMAGCINEDDALLIEVLRDDLDTDIDD